MRPRPRRRTRIGLAVILGVGVLATAPATVAQPSSKTHRIGWLAPAPNTANLDALRSGLRTLGYAEGTHFVVAQRYADTGPAALAEAAAELVRDRVALVVADGSAAALAFKRTARDTPVVFVSGDPLRMGLVASLARPGGLMTGLAIVGTELNVKRLEIVKTAFPHAARLGTIYEPRQFEAVVPPLESGARSLGLHLTRLPVRAADDFDAAFARAARERLAAVIVVASALFYAEKERLVSLAARHRVPAIYENDAFPEAGGLMSYGPDMTDVFRRAATYVDRILNGVRPADLPVEQPTKFDVVINQRTARALGLTIPQSLLFRAERIIE